MMDAMLELQLNQTAIARQLRPNTITSYKNILIAIGASSEWTVEDAQTAIDALEKPNTRKLASIAVRTVCELPVVIGPSVSKQWKIPESVDQLHLAFKDAKWSTQHYAMALLGCRVSEATALNRRSVDGNNVVIDRQNQHGRSVPLKSGNARVLLAPDWLSERLRQVEAPVSTSAVKSELNRLSKVYDLSLNADALRSFAANNLIKNGVDISTVSKFLGHTNLATTHSFYLQQDYKKVQALLTAQSPS